MVAWRTPPAPESWLGYDFRVDRDDLATQETAPFLFGGDVVDPEPGAWDRHEAAMRRHADTLSCLRPSEQEAARPNLLAFDWHRVQGYDRQVCLFRVATSLGSIERVRAWMAASEMTLAPAQPCRRCHAKDRDGVVLRGEWTLDQVAQRPDRHTPLVFLGLQLALQSLTRRAVPAYDWPVQFQFTFDDDERLMHADGPH